MDTLWWTYKKQLKMAIEIVDFPINSMVIFHGKMLVHLWHHPTSSSAAVAPATETPTCRWSIPGFFLDVTRLKLYPTPKMTIEIWEIML